MQFTIDILPDGKTLEFQILDRPGIDVENVDADELGRRLGASGVGAELLPSISAIRGIVARLWERSDLSDDVRLTLALLDQVSQIVIVVNFVESQRTIVWSEYRRKVLAVLRILAGAVPLGKGRITVTDGVFQAEIIRVLETYGASFNGASSEDRSKIVEEVMEEIFWLAGTRPGRALTAEALVFAGRKGGAPRGPRKRGATKRGKNDAFNELLRGVGFPSTAEGVKSQRKRRKRKQARDSGAPELLSKDRQQQPAKKRARQRDDAPSSGFGTHRKRSRKKRGR
jgi:hypothetical protein